MFCYQFLYRENKDIQLTTGLPRYQFKGETHLGPNEETHKNFRQNFKPFNIGGS